MIPVPSLRFIEEGGRQGREVGKAEEVWIAREVTFQSMLLSNISSQENCYHYIFLLHFVEQLGEEYR